MLWMESDRSQSLYTDQVSSDKEYDNQNLFQNDESQSLHTDQVSSDEQQLA